MENILENWHPTAVWYAIASVVSVTWLVVSVQASVHPRLVETNVMVSYFLVYLNFS